MKNLLPKFIKRIYNLKLPKGYISTLPTDNPTVEEILDNDEVLIRCVPDRGKAFNVKAKFRFRNGCAYYLSEKGDRFTHYPWRMCIVAKKKELS
jgi:type II restriction/modification system DNA methylase subunit YeeA